MVPLLRHYDHVNTARFVTVSCFHRYRLFTIDQVIQLFLVELDQIRKRHGIRLLGYVVMPEHVHLVIWPPDGLPLGRVVGELNSRSARSMLAYLTQQSGQSTDRLRIRRGGENRTAFWQQRCYDHNCRTSDAVREKIDYCHNNPVRRGLVSSPEKWRWSSFSWYQGEDDVPLVMDAWE